MTTELVKIKEAIEEISTELKNGKIVPLDLIKEASAQGILFVKLREKIPNKVSIYIEGSDKRENYGEIYYRKPVSQVQYEAGFKNSSNACEIDVVIFEKNQELILFSNVHGQLGHWSVDNNIYAAIELKTGYPNKYNVNKMINDLKRLINLNLKIKYYFLIFIDIYGKFDDVKEDLEKQLKEVSKPSGSIIKLVCLKVKENTVTYKDL